MVDGGLPEIVLLVGTFFAVLYGIFTAVALRQASHLRRGRLTTGGAPGSTAADAPRYVSRGEAFERNWQGSLGYQQPPDPQANENLADRLVPSVFFSLRTSRFRDSPYWRFYLVGVLAIRAAIFIALPVLALVLIGSSPASPAVSTFSPTTAEHQALHTATLVKEPRDCPTGRAVRLTSNSVPVATVSANADGARYTMPAGTLVVVSSYAGYPPSFDPTAPLCPAVLAAGPRTYVHDGFIAATPGTGFVYFPEPGGLASVAQIDVTGTGRHSSLVLVVLAIAVVAVDIVLRLRLRKAES
jgi:hypothetical protein